MRLMSVFAVLALTSPCAAETLGPPTDQFAASWSTPLTSQFTAWDKAPTSRTVTVKPGTIPDDALREAVLSAADVDTRRDLAIDEMANAFEPAQRTALEDLRDAQRIYAIADGGDRAERNAGFAVLIHDLVEGRGRSVAKDDVGTDDKRLDETDAHVAREAPDGARSSLAAGEKAWADYRDAFERYAQAMERPDAVPGLRDDLARRRADESQAAAAP